ncbi:hypothetical protein ABZ281_02765 [Streptomyces sp. NPDC006265]|uniref:hypothetical protein n=1 Tax=Streptomyces sp. NPDC006265 TaxID=3156740 RepID=UPI0033A9DE71
MVDGSPLALLGIRPTHHMIQFTGAPNPLTPRDRAFMDMGFTTLARNFSADFTTDPAWRVTLSPAGTYEVSYKSEGTQLAGSRPAPPVWLTTVRSTGRCLLVWQHTAGREVAAAELLRDMSAGNVLAVGAGYTST